MNKNIKNVMLGLFSFFLLIVKCDNAFANEDLPLIKENAPYIYTRSRLIKMGYRPSLNPKDRQCSVEYNDRCSRFPELVTCATDGLSPCDFEWRDRHGVAFIIETLYYTPETLKIASVYYPPFTSDFTYKKGFANFVSRSKK